MESKYLKMFSAKLNTSNLDCRGGYPAEGCVYGFAWKVDTIVPLLLKYRPDSGIQPPVLLDPFENYGFMLRVSAKLGWKYITKVAIE